MRCPHTGLPEEIVASAFRHWFHGLSIRVNQKTPTRCVQIRDSITRTSKNIRVNYKTPHGASKYATPLQEQLKISELIIIGHPRARCYQSMPLAAGCRWMMETPWVCRRTGKMLLLSGHPPATRDCM
jgi:hypothetical protein